MEFDILNNPVIHQRDNDGLFGGLWGPQINEGPVPDATSEQVFAGIVKHKLSHRSMMVHVFISTQTSTELASPLSKVAISVLDKKIIAIAKNSVDFSLNSVTKE